LDGNISKVDFYQGTTLIGTDVASPFTITWPNVPAGTYSLTAKATDDKGGITTSPATSVTVASCAPSSGVLISEFRLAGLNGSNDEFIELYNNTDQNIPVCTDDGSSGWALVSSDSVVKVVVPNGAVIPARAHYFAVSGGYSLGADSGLFLGELLSSRARLRFTSQRRF